MNRRHLVWDSRQWGVVLSTRDRPGCGHSDPMLLGSGWDRTPRTGHVGEPTRALLFTTRDQARAWCDVKNAGNLARGDDYGRACHFRPVRVRETVRVIR